MPIIIATVLPYQVDQYHILFVFDVVMLCVFMTFAFFLLREFMSQSERKLELSRANVRLARLIEVKDAFLRITSHQLQTPLFGIQGYIAELLENTKGRYTYGQILREDLVKLYLNAERLSTVVSDLSLANSISNDSFHIHRDQELDLDALIRDLVRDYQRFHQGKQCAIWITCEPDEYNIPGDVYYLKSALGKVLDNAFIFGYERLEVQVTCGTKYVTVKVIDDGIGITKQEHQRLYQPFQRGKRAFLLHPDGSGLGLYLARYIIELHGGDISEYSKGIDQGARFEIRLPKHRI